MATRADGLGPSRAGAEGATLARRIEQAAHRLFGARRCTAHGPLDRLAQAGDSPVWVALLAVALLVLSGHAFAADKVTPLRVGAFLDTVGVNIHMAFTDTAYGDVERVRRSLDYLGVNQVRNLLQSRSVDPAAGVHLDRLAASGICRFTFVATDPDLGRAMAWLDSFAGRFPGRIMGVEGPNEVDHWPVSYDGQTGLAAAVSYQRDLYEGVKADPALAGVPVLALTGLGRSWSEDLSKTVDFANEHPYARKGAPPAAHLPAEIDATHRRVAPGRPMVVTETGYPTLVGHPEIKLGRDGIDEDTQRSYLLDTLFDFAKAGVTKTFIYELLDEKADPEGRSIERHFGVFRSDGSPKPAAAGLHNLTRILADGGRARDTFVPAPVSLSIAGLPAQGASMVLAMSDGRVAIVVWAEPAIWDPGPGAPVPAPASRVNVTVGRSEARLAVYDPAVGTQPLDAPAIGSVAIVLTDHPVIVIASPPP